MENQDLKPTLFRRYESRGGKYRFDLFKDSLGFTFKEYQGGGLAGGGSYGTKTEEDVLAYVARYVSNFPSKMREIKI